MRISRLEVLYHQLSEFGAPSTSGNPAEHEHKSRFRDLVAAPIEDRASRLIDLPPVIGDVFQEPPTARISRRVISAAGGLGVVDARCCALRRIGDEPIVVAMQNVDPMLKCPVLLEHQPDARLEARVGDLQRERVTTRNVAARTAVLFLIRADERTVVIALSPVENRAFTDRCSGGREAPATAATVYSRCRVEWSLPVRIASRALEICPSVSRFRLLVVRPRSIA